MLKTLNQNSLTTNKENEVVLGIDFGGSASCVSFFKEGILESIYSNQVDSRLFSAKTFPSLAGFDENGLLIVGFQAKNKLFNPDCTIFDKLKEKLATSEKIYYKDKEIKIQLLIAEIFTALKKLVEKDLGVTITKTVLTTPANFGEEAKVILKDAAIIAGLDVLRLINEPTSAALYYSHSISSKPQTCLVVDIGSLTLDMTICHISKGFIDIESTNGDPICGHNLVEQEILKYICNNLQKKYPNLEIPDSSMKQLLLLAEQIKIEFSNSYTDKITIRKQLIIKGEKYLLNLPFTKSDLEDCSKIYFEKFEKVLNDLFKKSIYKISEINRLILVGGPANAVDVRKKIHEIIQLPNEIHFDNIGSVSKGAALYGAIILGQVEESKVLSDVAPISLGVEAENGIHEIIIPSGSRIPCTRRVEFTTSEDFQKLAKIKVLEGERPLAEHCKVLGTLILDQIEVNYKGAPIIEIEFSLDYNGMLRINVVDLKTRARRSSVMVSSTKLTELERLEIQEQACLSRIEDINTVRQLKLVADLKKLVNDYYNIIKKDIIALTELQKEEFYKAKALLSEIPINYELIQKQKEILELHLIKLRGSFFSDNVGIKRL